MSSRHAPFAGGAIAAEGAAPDALAQAGAAAQALEGALRVAERRGIGLGGEGGAQSPRLALFVLALAQQAQVQRRRARCG